jgi:hypothetical protein
MDLSFLVIVVIVTALVFDFTNGFHDTANAMATSIATGALKTKVAVGVAALSRRAVAVEEKKGSAPVDTAVAGLCFAACLAAVVYGLYLIVPQFH